MKRTYVFGFILVLSVLMSAGAKQTFGAAVIEDFESGYTLGQMVGNHADWYDGGNGPVVNSGLGVNGSVGLAPGNNIFIWTAHPFDWNATDFVGVMVEMDFQTDGSGHLDDDRIGWMITDNSVSSANIFGVQCDPGGSGYNIEGYWDGVTLTGRRPSIVDLPALSANTFYRFRAKITRLDSTSASIDVILIQLDSSGDSVAVAASGSIANTATLGDDAPNAKYFTGPIWPAFKNYTAAGANADNACYEVFILQPVENWTAYNDCIYQSPQYKGANVTEFGIGSGFAGSTSGQLLDQATGCLTEAMATLTQSGGVVWQPSSSSGGHDTQAGTDAYNIFHGLADMTGVIYYGSAGWYVDLTFTDLDPSKGYTFATSAARSDSTYSDRKTIYTISGADASTNSSSSGVEVLSPTSVRFVTGDNDAEGYVARWTDIDPGADGSFVVRAESDASSPEGRKAYAFDVFMIQEHDAVAQQCTLTVNIVGSGSVELDPPGGIYDEDTEVELTAEADSGWTFGGWSGDLSGSDNPDTVTMAGSLTVTATFLEDYTLSAGDVIISSLQAWNNPTGQDPGEFVELFNTTDHTISLANMELISRVDNDSDGLLEIDWELAASLAGKTIAPHSFFLVAESGVAAPGGVHDIETDMDLATGEGGAAERAISLELVIDSEHMDYVLYGRDDGQNPAGEMPPGDIAFDSTAWPRSEVCRNTRDTTSYQEGLLRRETVDDLYAGYAVNGYYTDEGSLGDGYPDGVWYSPHDHTYGSYQARNSESASMPPPVNHPPQATLVSPLDDSMGVSQDPELRVNVSDDDDDTMSVTFYGREKSTGEHFTLIPIPDTQHYSQYHPQIYKDQMRWLVDSLAVWNIVFAAHEGDVVNNAGTQQEWMNADTAMSILEDPVATGLPEGIPYSMVPGNHDQPTTYYNIYFGASRFSGRSYYGGHDGSTNDNNYCFFSAGGMDFIVVSLEYNAGSGPIAWADSLLGAHSDRRAIVVSHYLLDVGGGWGGIGQTVYDTLKDNPNLFLMLCGHIHGEALRSDVYNGHTVHTLLADYQDLPNGGNGWLRIMEFQPAEDRIRVLTYSPYLDQYGTDIAMGYDTKSAEFFLSYDMSGRADFVAIDTITGATSGSDVYTTWSGRDANKEYQWYVQVADGIDTTTSPVWSFTTGVYYDLTVNIVGHGRVSLSPPGGTYAESTAVELFAMADPGWVFDNWSGDLAGSANPDTISMTANMTVTATFQLAPVYWMAYNDLDPRTPSGPTDNAPNVTEHDYTVADGVLKNVATGDDLSVTMTGSYNFRDPHENGDNANAGTDAGDIFGPPNDRIVDLRATSELDSAHWYNTVTFEHLDPLKEYEITLTANRNNVEYAGARFARVTIQGAQTYTNESSAGVVVNSDSSVSFSIGYNTINGYVARWTGVTSGADSSFAVTSEWDTTQGSGDQNTKGYAMSVFWLVEAGDVSLTPEAVENLKIYTAFETSGAGSADIRLIWSPVTTDTAGQPITVDLYVIYRDTIPGFSAEPASEYDTTGDTTYVDVDVAGDSGTNMYYYVNARKAGQESADSQCVGEFDKDIRNVPK